MTRLLTFLFSFCFVLHVGTAQEIIIQEVLYNPAAGNDKITLCKTTPGTKDISSYRLCYRFSYPTLSSLTVESGSLNLSEDECVVLDMGTNNFNDTSSDIGLYISGGFGSAANMVDFVQYGTPSDVGRSDVAVAKGIWSGSAPNNYDFVPSAPVGQSLIFGGTNGGGGELTLSSDFMNSEVLPVELTSFKAYQKGEHILLNWTTASETNNSHFSVERSEDGQKFKKIKEIKGKGTTTETQYYEFMDKALIAPVLYYRLKQVDLDEQFQYSKILIVKVKKTKEQFGEFYPNPSASKIVNLEYYADDNQNITVSVFDMSGKVILSQIKALSKANNNLTIDFQSLKTGIYIIQLNNNQGSTYRKLILE